MVRRIYRTILLIIFFVSLFIVGNQFVINQFNVSSDKLIQEYNELYALQDFNVSMLLFQHQLQEVKYNEPDNMQFDSLMNVLLFTKGECERLVSQRHLNEQWDELLEFFQIVETSFPVDKENMQFDLINGALLRMLTILKNMIMETNGEIVETKYKNQFIHKHGSGTLLFVGIFFTIIISFLSFHTARDIAIPIREFLKAFEKLSAGEKQTRVPILAKDEFGKLATEFNELFDKLDNTTVTLEYVRGIIDNIFGALFVTDKNGIILSCNKIAVQMLSYPEQELIGKHISILFKLKELRPDNIIPEVVLEKNRLILELKNTKEIFTSKGSAIPVMTTCTEMQGQEEKGLIVVAHDISETLEYEKKLDEFQRKSLVAINEAQERERSRIASDLHDGLGQQLSAISYTIQNIDPSRPEPEKLIYLQKLIDDAIGESRSISHSLMPDVLRDFGLVAALNEMVQHYEGIELIKIDLNVYDFEERLDPKLENTLFRICQEALNNILKHARAKQAVLQLFKTKELVTLTIEDDGIGFNIPAMNTGEKGIGLMSIKERVYTFNGSFTIDSKIGQGTELIIEIPLA